MRCRVIAVFCVRLLLGSIVPHWQEALADAVALQLDRVVRARGFSSLYEEIAATGTFLGLPPAEVVPTLFRSSSGLSAQEREALLMRQLLESDTAPHHRAELAGVLFARIGSISDWSLVAMILTLHHQTADAAEVPPTDVYLDLSERLVDAVVTGAAGTTGYEVAALALASVVRRDAAEIAEIPGVTIALSESFRTVARASRDADVVAALLRSARALLAVESGARAGTGN